MSESFFAEVANEDYDLPSQAEQGLQPYYSEKYLRKAEERLKISPAQYLDSAAKTCAKQMQRDPGSYTRYGMFWWHMKQLMLDRADDPKAWWHAGTMDEWTMQLVDRRDELKNVLQAVHYSHENITKSPIMNYTIDGNIRSYSCFDEDAPY